MIFASKSTTRTICTAAALWFLTVLDQSITVSAATAAEWKGRAIYQVVTDRFYNGDGKSSAPCDNLSLYCGGTFDGITQKLDYIHGMGFDAIWISPVVKNMDNGYHGYWAQDFYSTNPNFGTLESLSNLVKEAHQRDMFVMVDVVANHAGFNGDFSSTAPFNTSSDYHSRCDINNWNDQTQVEQCWVTGQLSDLNTEDPWVQAELGRIVRWWVTKAGPFDGVRIDTVKHVRKDFWTGFTGAAGVFAMGEVFSNDAGYVGDYQKVMDSLHSYPMYYQLRNVFQQKQSMWSISNQVWTDKQNFKDTTVLGSFVENHDMALYKNALAYVMMAEGIPTIYYGAEQAYAGGQDPGNREPLWTSGWSTDSDLYKFLKTLNTVRTKDRFANNTMNIHVSDNIYTFTRGNAFIALSNVGSGQSVEAISPVPSSFKNGAGEEASRQRLRQQ
ncbi:a-amylase [Jimgerdemannia flammicorona]|uniref:alpha-amylase n=1 Tax=Jimgerdemannia flammicorona TaxID=994334 RepID=A0A433Q652_9FUNG|nr:a-amylase [Jimgerdemannia flammicorona]